MESGEYFLNAPCCSRLRIAPRKRSVNCGSVSPSERRGVTHEALHSGPASQER